MYRRRSTSLTSSPEFERVYRKGSAYRGKLFSVHALPNTMGKPRLGLSVSKKVGTAVNRNKAEASFEELNEEFLRSLRKLNKGAADLRDEVST